MSGTSARAFNRSGATQAVAIDISKVWYTGLHHKQMPYRISDQIFEIITSFLSNRWLRLVLNGSLHKNIQLMLEFLKAPFLVLPSPTIHELPDDAICNISIHADNTTLYSKCD